MIKIKEKIKEFYEEIYLSHYLSNNEIRKIESDYNDLFFKIRKNLFFKIKYYKDYRFYKNIYQEIDKINNEKIENKINYDSNILDDIKGYPLDYDQKKVVYTDEDNTLVVAGAGSGKSLTIIGKIRYLIEEKNIKAEEILCISFTNASTISLKDSIKKSYGYDVDVKTFHKLALDIIKDENYLIASSDLLEYIVNEIFNSSYLSINIIKDKFLIFSLKKNIITFIHLFKSNGYIKKDFVIFYKKINKEKNPYMRKKLSILLNIIEYFYYIYEEELISQNKIDFDDMIIKAKKYVDKNGIYKNYKYIIIDEFQDASLVRFDLINSIKKCCNSKIMAVGDDFQSIYRFSGCDLDIFLNFSKYFGFTKILKIRNTYRNSKELIDIAGKFVMKNPMQIKKKLNSSKNIEKPIKILFYSDTKKDIIKLIEKIYKKNKEDILILGRNNFDINEIISDKLLKSDDDNLIYTLNRDIKIKYMTVHKSKGLESSSVIIINVIDDKFGFPNKMTNDQIISLVINDKKLFPYDEERRLFYVALTRTKNSVYIFTKKNKESIFIKEILNYNTNSIEIIRSN